MRFLRDGTDNTITRLDDRNYERLKIAVPEFEAVARRTPVASCRSRPASARCGCSGHSPTTNSRADTSISNPDENHPASLVLDATFARALGFADPRDAVDQTLYVPGARAQVVGVVEDKPMPIAGNGVVGTVYFATRYPEQLLIRVDKNDVAGALAAVQRV